jgi:glutathione S-transferase
VGYVYVGFAAGAIGGAPATDGRPALKAWYDNIAARAAIQRSA